MAQPEFLALAVLLLFAGIMFLAITGTKKDREKKQARALQLGLDPLEHAPDELLSRLEALHRTRKKQTLEARQVYQEQGFDRQLYLFDLIDTHEEDSVLAREMFGVISHRLALPHFSMITLLPIDTDRLLGGLMERLMDRFFDWAGKFQQLQRITFPTSPEFEEHFVVFGRDPQALRKLFSGSAAAYLMGLNLPLMLAGSGDFLTVTIGYPQQDAAKGHLDQLRELYRETNQLVRLLES